MSQYSPVIASGGIRLDIVYPWRYGIILWQPSIEYRDTYPRRRVRGLRERDGLSYVPHDTASRFELQSGHRT